MKPFNAALKKMRAICLSLPDTKETPTWGQPHFRVGEKIFAGLGEEAGALTVGFKLERDHADAIVRRRGFSRAPYVGHKGWVSADVEVVTDWAEVRQLVHESYRLIAPKKTLAKGESAPGAEGPTAVAAGRASRPAKRSPRSTKTHTRRRSDGRGDGRPDGGSRGLRLKSR
jgi:predicted DNA-binding protein (MmcQ/YjbR family)